jgi:hypothetical protein
MGVIIGRIELGTVLECGEVSVIEEGWGSIVEICTLEIGMVGVLHNKFINNNLNLFHICLLIKSDPVSPFNLIRAYRLFIILIIITIKSMRIRASPLHLQVDQLPAQGLLLRLQGHDVLAIVLLLLFVVLLEEAEFGLSVLATRDVALDQDAAELVDEFSGIFAFGNIDAHAPDCIR